MAAPLIRSSRPEDAVRPEGVSRSGPVAEALALRSARVPELQPPLDGEIIALSPAFGQVMLYAGGDPAAPPLLLIHSINAAANAYEMKPLFEHYGGSRAVYALDLPGYGLSDRRDVIYTPAVMIEAILAAVAAIRQRHGEAAIDAIALSLSSEFLARAAMDHASLFRSLGLVSPTGLSSKMRNDGPLGSTFAKPGVWKAAAKPFWAQGLFDLLVSRPSMRFFLRKTWGSPAIDEGLFAYDYVSAHQRGARHAPFSFLSGYLFSADMGRVYGALAMPVWMCHGIRGDFVDFKRKDEVASKPNWTVAVFPTGAMAHFERLDLFTAAYDAFLRGPDPRE